MNSMFVTGTDTGVGKTVVTGLIARYLQEKGYNVVTQKWVQSGSSFPKDINEHLKIMQKSREHIKGYLQDVCPYIFKLPSSPHLASKRERKQVSSQKIKRGFNRLLSRFDWVIVEGIGGVLVPYNNRRLVIDIVQELKLPVVIVVGNKLGAINHTLLTVEALRKRRIKLLGIIFSNLKKEDIVLKDNPKIIQKLSGEIVLGTLPYERNKSSLYEYFSPIGRKLLKLLKL